MELTIHRGSKEVGGSCVELKSGSTRIILDVGMPLFDANRKSVNTFAMRRMTTEEFRTANVLPNIEGLFRDRDSPPPDAILLSHAHLDHTGLLNHTKSEIPVYASGGTSKMMLAGSLFAGQVGLNRVRFQELKPAEPHKIGSFTVTAYPVDHSIYGCQAFLIEADGKRLFYSGDIRVHGRKPGMQRDLIEALKDQQIDAMLMEGTHFGLPDGPSDTEYDLEEKIVERIKSAKSLVLASFSPQHIDRFVAFIRAAIKTNRVFVVDLYAAFILHLLRNDIKLPVPEASDHIRVYVPENQERKSSIPAIAKFIENCRDATIKIDEIVKSPGKFVFIFRPSMVKDDFGGRLPPETDCVYSRWNGYLENEEWQQVSMEITNGGGRVFVEHTSGHILSSDIAKFVSELSPKVLIPIHTFEPERFSELFENTQILRDGVSYEIQ